MSHRDPRPKPKSPPSGLLASVDGVLVDAAAAALPLLDQAYLTGMGAFETMRAMAGVPLFLDAHRERLVDAGRVFGIDIPSAATLRRQVTDLLAAAGLVNARVRVTASSAQGMDGVPFRFEGPACITVLAFPMVKPQRGRLRVTLLDDRIDPRGALSGMKCTSYAARALWMRKVREAGADEGLLLDQRSRLSGAVVSNLFWVAGGRVRTPDAERCGCRAGVTRARVIAACEHLGIPCEIVAVKPSDLFDADEVFLTSTIRGLAGVAQIDAHAFPAGGPITGKLRTALARETMREAAAT